MFLYMVCTDLGYHRFIVENEKFINVYVRAPTQSDAMSPQCGRSGSRLDTSHAAVSLLLCSFH